MALFRPSRTQWGPVAHLGFGQEKRGYPLTVAGTAADLKANPRTAFPFHPSFLRHHLPERYQHALALPSATYPNRKKKIGVTLQRETQ